MTQFVHRYSVVVVVASMGCGGEPLPQGPSEEGFVLKKAVVGSTAAWVHAESDQKLDIEVRKEDGSTERLSPSDVTTPGQYHWVTSSLKSGNEFRILSNGVPGHWLQPRALNTAHEWAEDLAYWNDEGMTVQFGQPDPGLGIWFGLINESGNFEPVDSECLLSGRLENCRSASAQALENGIPPVFLTSEHSRWWEVAVAYGPVGEDRRLKMPDSYLSVDTHRVMSMGAQVIWGDLHGHSSLSTDGCEQVFESGNLQGCEARAGEPASTFFQEAIANGLDFAAITDHAELEYWETPITLGEQRSIWETQSDRASEAEAEGFIALLGYEWTSGSGTSTTDESGHFRKGHKTVVLEDTRSHTDWRVAASYNGDELFEQSGEYYTVSNQNIGATPQALYGLLDLAAETHGSQEVLVFAHHPGMYVPQAHDWRQVDNRAVDPRYETVVEIHSEHGSSECVDLEGAHCDFGYSEHRGHFPYGSVQYALMEGLRLGFVGGTDSHDSRPGSLEDGGGAQRGGDGGVHGHPYDGAITGVMVFGKTKEDLFKGLKARNTLVTTGPVLDVRAVVVDADDAIHAPGTVLASGQVRAIVEVPDWPDGVLESIELIRPDNSVAASTTESRLDVVLEASEGEVFYTRVRFDQDGKEQRYWASPWFFEESG